MNVDNLEPATGCGEPGGPVMAATTFPVPASRHLLVAYALACPAQAHVWLTFTDSPTVALERCGRPGATS